MGKRNSKKSSSLPKKAKDLRPLYAKIRREFSAADLQKYTVIEEGIPAEQVLAEMEEIHNKVMWKEGSLTRVFRPRLSPLHEG